jgi:outer membrane protein OmpA-like peptidoglycan-associated protein
MKMKIRLLNVFVLVASVSFAAKAQTGNVTGITINLEGTLMYYTAEKSGEHALYKAVKNAAGTWDAGISEDSFNEYIAGSVVKTPFLTCDEQTLYFSANLPGSRGFDIFYSRKNGDSWSKPVALSPVINTDKDEISPSLPAGNLTIYFARNGLENDCYNIYVSEVDVSGWSVPQMLPAPISMGCEKHAYISPTGETLLFSTDRLSDKKKKKYNIFYSTLLSKNIWSAPTPVDQTVKEYSEFTPAIDYQNSKIFVTRGRTDSSTDSIYSCDAPVYKPYTIIKGIVRDENGKPVDAGITIRNAYTNSLYGTSNSNPANGKYTVVLPNNGLYHIDYTVKNGARLFENINSADNSQGQTIVKDVTLIDKIIVNLTVQDALSDKFVDADIQAYEKTKTAKVSKVGEGKYRILIPTFENVDIELYKENYVKENILVKFGDYSVFPEMYYAVKLTPDMRSGVINVKDIASNQGVNANLNVKNLDIDDEKIHISADETGKYEFDIRKDCKYSISVTLKDYFYYYTVWNADASRIGQTLDIHLVPLTEINKIPMPNLLFPDNRSTLSSEASGELACVAKVLKNNPEYKAIISLYHTNSEKELVIAQQRARSVITFLETSRIPQARYKIELSPIDRKKIYDISFVTNTPPANKK